MGARLTHTRWFRDGKQAESRLWCHLASDVDLQKRLNDLDFLDGLVLLSADSRLERWRIKQESDRRDKQSWSQERCPICGGWRKMGEHLRQRVTAHPTLGYILCCRDCGWPHAENIYGGHIIYPGPRTGFRMSRLSEDAR